MFSEKFCTIDSCLKSKPNLVAAFKSISEHF